MLPQCQQCDDAAECVDDPQCIHGARKIIHALDIRLKLTVESRRKIIAQRDAAREQICELRKLVRTILARHEPEMLKIYDEAWEAKHE